MKPNSVVRKGQLVPALAMLSGLLLFFLAGACAGYMQAHHWPTPALLPDPWQSLGVVAVISLITGLGGLLIYRAIKAEDPALTRGNNGRYRALLIERNTKAEGRPRRRATD